MNPLSLSLSSLFVLPSCSVVLLILPFPQVWDPAARVQTLYS